MINIIISLVRSKVIALLIGPIGMGISNLLLTTMELINGLTNLGLERSAVKDISLANTNSNSKSVAKTISILKKLVWLTITIGVILMIALSPGPSWAYTISTTLGHGRRAGMIGNLGNSTGILCHAVAVALGLAALLQYSSAAFHTLKFPGVAYLAYLAWRALRGGTTLNATTACASPPSWKIFRNGAFVSIFNPKISLLMLALLPQFVDPAANNPELQIAAMGATHALVAGIVHTHLILFSSGIAHHLKQSGRLQKSMRWATGAVFLGFGARLALTDR